MNNREFRERYQYDAEKDLLGEGGFGRVYRAYDTVEKDWVALKLFFRGVGSKYDLINEIRRAKSLSHPNICRYFHAELIRGTDPLGEAQEIQVGIMELVKGGTIDVYLSTHPEFQKNLLIDVLRGLSYLHSLRPPIIHRDLKPSNVLVHLENGVPTARITDFGISKSLGTSGARTSGAVGTYEYMAPERFNPVQYGANGEIGCNTDLWSFGAMLMELLTGELPFGGGAETSTGQIMESIIRGIPQERLDSFEEPYRSVLKRCMVQHAGRRAQRAEDLLVLLADTEPVRGAIRRDTVDEDKAQSGVAETIDDVQLPVGGRQKTRKEWVVQGGAGAGKFEVENPRPIEPPKLLVEEPERRLGSRTVGFLAAGAALVVVFGIGVAMWGHFGSRFQNQTPLTAVQGPAAPADLQPANSPPSGTGRSRARRPASSQTNSGPAIQSQSRSASGQSSSLPPGQTVVTQSTSDQSTSTGNGNSQSPTSELSPADLFRQANGLYSQNNYSAAAPLYERSCVAGNGAACRQLGWMHQQAQGFPKDYVEARRLFQIACNLGDALGCNDYGALLAAGQGGAMDSAGAATYFTKACNAGFAPACQNAQSAGQTVQSPPSRAGDSMSQTVQSCSAGDANNCNVAGEAYRDGQGETPRDYSRALAMFLASCNLRNGYGCTALGAMYRDGLGVPKNDGLTVEYFARGCDYHDAAGCSYLGNNYRYGLGVRQNLTTARQLFSRGCVMGNQWGCEQLQQMR